MGVRHMKIWENNIKNYIQQLVKKHQVVKKYGKKKVPRYAIQSFTT